MKSKERFGGGICPLCSGSGEGMADGTTCPKCKGHGETPESLEFDPADFDEDDDNYLRWRHRIHAQ